MRAGVAQHEIVFRRTALVAISLDLQLVAGKLLQNLRQFFRIGRQRGDRVIAQGVFIVIEVGVLNAADQLVDTCARGGIGV